MHDEGVTKFHLAFTPAPALPAASLETLIAWRSILWRLDLIGQDSARYGGVGFGNVSRRLPRRARGAMRFAISGTQTGARAVLDASHFAIVTACDAKRNRVEAEGPIAPSSESLTHGMLYAIDPAIGFVLHVHCPEIWRARRALRLPATAADVPYGTPAMAREMKRLLRRRRPLHPRVVVMGGHADGVITFGRTADEAGVTLLRTLARALPVGPRSSDH